MNINNDPLHKAFSRLKEADAARSPSFDRVIRRSRSQAEISFFAVFPWGKLVAGMALVLAFLYLAWDFKKPTPEIAEDSAAWAAISNWTSSSDELFAGPLLSSSLSTTTDSWIQGGDTSKTQTESL